MTDKYKGLSFDQRIDKAFEIFADYAPRAEHEQVTMEIMRILLQSRYDRYHKNLVKTDQKSPESRDNTKEMSDYAN